MSQLKREAPPKTLPAIPEQTVRSGDVTVGIKIDRDNTAKIDIENFAGNGFWMTPANLRELAELFVEIADETERVRKDR